MEEKHTVKNIIMKITMAVLIVSIVIIIWYDFTYVIPTPLWYDTSRVQQRALVVKVEGYGLGVVLLEDDGSFGEYEKICKVPFGKKGNIGFKKGQEILIYYSGYSTDMAPGELMRSFKNHNRKRDKRYSYTRTCIVVFL